MVRLSLERGPIRIGTTFVDADRIMKAFDTVTAPVTGDRLILQFDDMEVNVLTGIYSEETHLPQPLRISIQAELAPLGFYAPDTPLAVSKNYMDLKHAATAAIPPGVHFKLIEAVADCIAGTIFAQDGRVLALTIKIVKLAIAEGNERIGITMTRQRPAA